MRTLTISTLLATALLLPLAAFADDDDKGDDKIASDAKTFTIVMKNHEYDPMETVVPAKTPFKLVVKNQDSSPIEFESEQMHREKIVQPGKDVTLQVAGLKPGTYEFTDDFHSDSKGFITVK